MTYMSEIRGPRGLAVMQSPRTYFLFILSRRSGPGPGNPEAGATSDKMPGAWLWVYYGARGTQS